MSIEQTPIPMSRASRMVFLRSSAKRTDAVKVASYSIAGTVPRRRSAKDFGRPQCVTTDL
jgi:hypothetical protein